MAYGNDGNGSGNDRNRDGIDDEFDRQPGNQGTSVSYARIYDPRSQLEFSNRLEPQNQIEEARILREVAAQSTQAREALKAAQGTIHVLNVGKFIIPAEQTWIANAELVKDDSLDLHFDTKKYIFFDKIIAEKFKNPALYDPNHKDFPKLEGLRTNIEVLRNDLFSRYLNDGSFDPGDEIVLPKITGIAAAIGEALANDKWYKRPFVSSVGLDVANVEGVGARELYKHLLEVMNDPKQDTPLRHETERLLNIPGRHWNLPILEKSTFSAEGLSAPLPLKQCLPIMAHTVGNTPMNNSPMSNRMAECAERCIGLARRMRTPESLDVPTQEKSIDEARTILRYLKNLQFGDKPMEEWLDQGTPAEQQAKAEAVSRLVELYGGQLKIAANKFPGISDSMVIDSASQAAGAVALAVGQHTLDNLPDDHPHIESLENALNNVPAAWEQRQNHSTERLLEMIETGIEWSSGKNVSDKTAIDRLVEMSNRIGASARKLQSVDAMQAPARIESVELAREILRRLKGLGFSDKPIESLIKPGNADDKAALAQQLAEMAEIYGNILAEAAQSNPEIMKDKRVQDASNAVGQLTHTVKLMAAKEIPSDMAASQQISADVTQMPEEWKQLSGRTMDRLMKSMEGGLEKAVQELQVQQQELAQQQDEELASKSVENSLLGEAAGKKKRRRRSSGSKKTASLTKSAKRRNANDLNGDGVADRLQGMGLNDKDLIAVRELGDSLRNIGNKATDIIPPPVEVAAASVVAPDGQSFADQQSSRRNNRRPGTRNTQTQV